MLWLGGRFKKIFCNFKISRAAEIQTRFLVKKFKKVVFHKKNAQICKSWHQKWRFFTEIWNFYLYIILILSDIIQAFHICCIPRIFMVFPTHLKRSIRGSVTNLSNHSQLSENSELAPRNGFKMGLKWA